MYTELDFYITSEMFIMYMYVLGYDFIKIGTAKSLF